uniref:Uncharacterized protein n=1 Tax=Anguilla anguilla TaxID=7936 RepID=A0A0E9X959_ANGAN
MVQNGTLWLGHTPPLHSGHVNLESGQEA